MKFKELNLSNIIAFVKGHYKAHYITLQNLPLLEQEQVLYRFKVCEDTCLKEGKCKHCFCDVPERMFIDKRLHECPYPKFLNQQDWDVFKATNDYIE